MQWHNCRLRLSPYMENDAIIRLSIFISLLLILLLIESFIPKVKPLQVRHKHCLNNIGLIMIGSLFARLLFPTGLGAYALLFSDIGFGLLNHINLVLWQKVIISLIVLDGIIYWQHRLFHTNSQLWRMHKVHHSDLDIDTSSALRFHPLEILISMAIKLFFIALLGIPAEAIILFEILLNSLALFNHSNICIVKRFDTILQWFIVTPDMHRIHHSINIVERNSNYGFNLSLWDRLFFSYTQGDDQKITVGLLETPKILNLWALLILPFQTNVEQK